MKEARASNGSPDRRIINDFMEYFTIIYPYFDCRYQFYAILNIKSKEKIRYLPQNKELNVFERKNIPAQNSCVKIWILLVLFEPENTKFELIKMD